MTQWLSEMFGRAADTFADAVADARAKLIDESWFGRRVPEQQGRGDLGWFLDHLGASEPEPAQDLEQDRGIDC